MRIQFGRSFPVMAIVVILGSTAAGAPGNAKPAASGIAPSPTAVDADGEAKRTAKIGGPVTINYRLIGRPAIGQPLSIALLVTSALTDRPVRVDYRILDVTALRLADSQLPYATIDQATDVSAGEEQVTVVPLREGRTYLNVAATVETEEGSIATVTAIPIQVGERTRARENGVLSTDSDGAPIRVLQGSED